MYFQGAGASRPIADNSDSTERSKNRRVEIVEVNDNTTLLMRAKVEQNNPRYLVHGTSTVARTAPIPSATPSPEIAKQRAANDTSEEVLVTTEAVTRQAEVARGNLVVDFGGSPTDILTWNLSQDIKPKSSGFSLISSAHASDLPMRGCEADLPRQSGDVFNLASGKVLATHNTTDYLPGYNNRVWAQTVNGHLVTLSPVSILQDGAKVDRQPFVQVVKGYEAGNRKAMVNSQAVANTYEGEDRVLYRVFVGGTEAPISCMDVVFSKGNAQSTDGLLFYSDSKGQSYSASFVPVRT